MNIDLHAYSSDLLERLGNSIYDRQGHEAPQFTFTIQEIHIVEQWLKEVLACAIDIASDD